MSVTKYKKYLQLEIFITSAIDLLLQPSVLSSPLPLRFQFSSLTFLPRSFHRHRQNFFFRGELFSVHNWRGGKVEPETWLFTWLCSAVRLLCLPMWTTDPRRRRLWTKSGWTINSPVLCSLRVGGGGVLLVVPPRRLEFISCVAETNVLLVCDRKLYLNRIFDQCNSSN